MEKLQPEETELIGKWILEDRKMRADDVCGRVEWLAAHHLRRIAISEEFGGWETLFQDPDDARFWERTFPQGEMHGGGPPALLCLSEEQAKAKYKIG
jgi:hypothetical protein